MQFKFEDGQISRLKIGAGNINYINIDSDGNMVLIGEAKTWRDEAGDALSLKVQGTGVSVNAIESTVDFASTANLSDYIFKNVQLNHDRDLTATIHPHLHFFQSQNKMPNFLLQYRWQILNTPKVTAWTSMVFNIPVFNYVSGVVSQISEGVYLTPPANTKVSDILQIRVLRDTTNASGLFSGVDTYTGNAEVTSFDIHIQTNSFGSNTEFIK